MLGKTSFPLRMCLASDPTLANSFPPPTPASVPQGLVDAGIYVQTEHSAHGPYFRHGPKATFSLTPGRAGPGSQVGEHTVALLKELGYNDQAIQRLKGKGIVTWPETS